jgi:DNA polymerase
MRKITIDFETRSACDLKTAGAWKYAAHPSTEIICLAVKPDNMTPYLWAPDKFLHYKPVSVCSLNFDEIEDIIYQSDIIEAHNVTFERAIWHHVMAGRHGFSDLPVEKLRCSAAKAAAYALPRDLAGAGEALGLATTKDQEGHRLMLKLCKPRQPRKAERDANPLHDLEYYWHETPDEIRRLMQYCVQDVEAEYSLSETLRDLQPRELRIWQVDQEINARGIYADVDAALSAIDMINRHKTQQENRSKEIAGVGPRQVAKLLEWVNSQGVQLENMQAETIRQALTADLPPAVREVLEIRQSLSKSSTAKYEAILKRAGTDNRIRDSLLYCGAPRTGRWAGRGIQPQNMPRGVFQDVDNALDLIRNGNMDLLQLLFGDPMESASTCIRSILCAAPGHDLICADFASIEAIGLAYLAGEQKVLDAFMRRLDLYKVAAQAVYSKMYDEINKDERQIGKVVVLACGYQGRIGAFQSMARGYGVHVADERAAEIVDEWRRNNSAIVDFWGQVENAAFIALRNPGQTAQYRNIQYLYTPEPAPGFLCCKLPSGRILYYAHPIIKEEEGWGKQITYMGLDSYTYKWSRLKTYGGKLVENIVQAFCRDILADAMLRVDRAGYQIVLSVHDEIVSEVPAGQGDLDEYCSLMEEPPVWAPDMPIRAEGWIGKRYKK